METSASTFGANRKHTFFWMSACCYWRPRCWMTLKLTLNLHYQKFPALSKLIVINAASRVHSQGAQAWFAYVSKPIQESRGFAQFCLLANNLCFHRANGDHCSAIKMLFHVLDTHHSEQCFLSLGNTSSSSTHLPLNQIHLTPDSIYIVHF